MNEKLLGQYDLSHVLIDCNYSYSDFAVYAHELAHFSLTKNTLFGILHFIAEQSNELAPNKELDGIIAVMTDASERTQEIYAMYYELLHVSSQYKEFFKSYYLNFKQRAYYSKYQFQDFEWSTSAKGLNDDAKLIDRLAAIAMNVDITEFANQNPWESSKGLFTIILENKPYFMPDFRLEKLLILVNALGMPKIHEMTDHEIAIAADIEYLDFTTETVLGLLKRLRRQFEEVAFDSSLICANIENIEINQIKLGYYLPKDDNFNTNLKQTILLECLNHKFEDIPLTTLPNKNVHDIELITLYDYSPACLCEFTDFKKSCKYSIISGTIVITKYLKDYSDTIQFYFDDYKTVLQNWSSLGNRHVFFILKNPYYEFKHLIANHVSEKRYALMCKLNEGVFLLFVLDNSNNVFYTCQSMINLEAVLADFSNGFFSSPDNLFWIESDKWCDCIRIMSYVSEMNILEKTQEEFITRIICAKC